MHVGRSHPRDNADVVTFRRSANWGGVCTQGEAPHCDNADVVTFCRSANWVGECTQGEATQYDNANVAINNNNHSTNLFGL